MAAILWQKTKVRVDIKRCGTRINATSVTVGGALIKFIDKTACQIMGLGEGTLVARFRTAQDHAG